MTTYISILRGINVSGQRLIKMEALRKLYMDSGFQHVQTYIQSGNVIFQYKESDLHHLENKITQMISVTFSFEVPVLVMNINELRSVLENNPYTKDKAKDPAFFHITFLSAEPAQERLDKIKKEQYYPDEFECSGKAIYLYCPNGYGKTKLTNNFFESKLKVIATARNWKTSLELLNLAEKASTITN